MSDLARTVGRPQPAVRPGSVRAPSVDPNQLYQPFSFDNPSTHSPAFLHLKSVWGGIAAPLPTKSLASAGYTFTDTDGLEVLLVTTGASDRTISFASLTSASANRRFKIVKVDSGLGHVILSGTISGLASPTMNSQYYAAEVFFDGTNLFLLSKYGW